MIKINRYFLIFTIFLGYTTPKCLPSRTNELKVFGRLKSTYFYERHVLGAIYHRIWQQLQMVFSHPPSGTMKLTFGSNQRYKRGQKSPLDPTAFAGPLQSGYSHVHGRLKTSKMVKIVISSPSPPGLKQIFGETNRVGVFEGSLWTFSHREIQINGPFFLCCPVLWSTKKKHGKELWRLVRTVYYKNVTF